jgi:hypothetical protein
VTTNSFQLITSKFKSYFFFLGKAFPLFLSTHLIDVKLLLRNAYFSITDRLVSNYHKFGMGRIGQRVCERLAQKSMQMEHRIVLPDSLTHALLKEIFLLWTMGR